MWKLQDFSATQILREINLREYGSSKIAFFCNFRGSEFCQFGEFQPSKSVKHHRNINSEPLNLLKGDFVLF